MHNVSLMYISKHFVFGYTLIHKVTFLENFASLITSDIIMTLNIIQKLRACGHNWLNSMNSYLGFCMWPILAVK